MVVNYNFNLLVWRWQRYCCCVLLICCCCFSLLYYFLFSLSCSLVRSLCQIIYLLVISLFFRYGICTLFTCVSAVLKTLYNHMYARSFVRSIAGKYTLTNKTQMHAYSCGLLPHSHTHTQTHTRTTIKQNDRTISFLSVAFVVLIFFSSLFLPLISYIFSRCDRGRYHAVVAFYFAI